MRPATVPLLVLQAPRPSGIIVDNETGLRLGWPKSCQAGPHAGRWHRRPRATLVAFLRPGQLESRLGTEFSTILNDGACFVHKAAGPMGTGALPIVVSYRWP